MKYFTSITTLDDLKKAYRRLAFTNHPDRGGMDRKIRRKKLRNFLFF